VDETGINRLVFWSSIKWSNKKYTTKVWKKRYDRKTGKWAIFGYSDRVFPPIQYSDFFGSKERAQIQFDALLLRPFAHESVQAASSYGNDKLVRSKFEIFDHPVDPLGPNIFRKSKAQNISHPSLYLSLNHLNTTARG
jgi:hypothetical protein